MEQELLDKIEELEARIKALEDGSCEDCDETCPECGEDPCVCDEDDDTDEEVEEDEIDVIDDDDVEEVEELNFKVPRFMKSDDYENDEESPEADGGLYDYESKQDDEEEDSDGPYYK